MSVLNKILTLFVTVMLLQGFTIVQAKEVLVKNRTLSDFFKAAKTNDTVVLQRLLDRKIFPVDTKDVKGRTALLIATHNNSITAADVLITAGADVNAKDKIQDSPYLYAGAEGRLEILKLTVAAGADLKSINRYGGTALTPAAHHGHVDVVRYLLTTEIDVDQVNNLGWTALLEAVILGDGGIAHQQIVKMLLDSGADPTISDDEDITPLKHAKNGNKIELIKLFEQ